MELLNFETCFTVSRALSSTYRIMSSVMVVDILGFQDPNACGRQEGASFRDLCDNYAQERLQLLFHESTFTSQQDKYAQVIVSLCL